MLVSQKNRYALRAVFELARLYGQGPAKVADIAEAQGIPPRFLEIILNELKQAGFVASRRGKEGGFFLTRDPRDLAAADVMNFVGGPINVLQSAGEEESGVFSSMWQQVQDAISEIFDTTTFADLVEEERRKARKYVPAYAI
jgi:Rrf2 family cysteine metabolism transcriptional repressor